MRRLRETEAHAARTAVIQGDFPEGMKARCAFCARVESVAHGELLEVNRTGMGPSRVFRCSECSGKRKGDAAA